MPPRPPVPRGYGDEEPAAPSKPPLTQKQEDLLLELFLQLDVSDRKKVIKFCRDLQRAAAEGG